MLPLNIFPQLWLSFRQKAKMLVPKKDTLFSSWQTHPHHTSLVSSATKLGAAAKGQNKPQKCQDINVISYSSCWFLKTQMSFNLFPLFYQKENWSGKRKATWLKSQSKLVPQPGIVATFSLRANNILIQYQLLYFLIWE